MGPLPTGSNHDKTRLRVDRRRSVRSVGRTRLLGIYRNTNPESHKRRGSVIRYVIRGEKPPLPLIVSELVIGAFALLVVAPFVWYAADRTPPMVRLYGEIVPDPAPRGSDVHVEYIVTKRIRDECPGTVHQEIVDSGGTTYQKTAKPVSATYRPDGGNRERLI